MGDLDHELTYAQNHGGRAGLRLVPGTETFSPVSDPQQSTSPFSQQGSARTRPRVRADP